MGRIEIPAKLYFRIGEAASVVGVEPHVLRYWETEFRSIRPKKSARGQRVYSRREVESLVRIKELLYDQGFTIAGAKRRMRERGVEPPQEPSEPTAEESKVMRETLLSLRAEMVAALEMLGADMLLLGGDVSELPLSSQHAAVSSLGPLATSASLGPTAALLPSMPLAQR